MNNSRSEEIISIISLGCSKNLVDSEMLVSQLKANNLKILHDKVEKNTSTVIINTCGFINDAKQQSIDTILQYIDLKERGVIKRVYVIGCLSERYKDDLKNEIPEVDKYFGTYQLEDIVSEIGVEYKANLIGEKVALTPSHYSYIKIAEGCDRTCSFCAIPIIKGKYKSKPIDSIVKEVKFMADKGVKEIMLIAQDLTYYGIDIYKSAQLVTLLDKLSNINGMEWIRLHYAYPAKFPLDIIRIMKERNNICNYLDMPIQHISDKLLKLMRRNIDKAATIKLLDDIKVINPEISLRTTILTGHPGEGKREFNELLNFIKEYKFDRLGVFTYSHEEDTFSYNNFKNSISEKEKNIRKDLIMEAQMNISLEKNKSNLGKEIKVLVDELYDGKYYCRSESDSPEVDNKVIVSADNLEFGNFYKVKITDYDEYDLFASVI